MRIPIIVNVQMLTPSYCSEALQVINRHLGFACWFTEVQAMIAVDHRHHASQKTMATWLEAQSNGVKRPSQNNYLMLIYKGACSGRNAAQTPHCGGHRCQRPWYHEGVQKAQKSTHPQDGLLGSGDVLGALLSHGRDVVAEGDVQPARKPSSSPGAVSLSLDMHACMQPHTLTGLQSGHSGGCRVEYSQRIPQG